MKKVFSLLCACVMLLTMIPKMTVSVSAADTAVVSIETVKSTPLSAGKTFQVKITTGRIAKVAAFEFRLKYDATKVKAISGTTSGWLDELDLQTVQCNPVGPVHADPSIGEVWITGMGLKEKDSVSGEVIATITFKTLKNITEDLVFAAFGDTLVIKKDISTLPVTVNNGGLDVGFSDVKDSEWYRYGVHYVAAKGYIKGYTNGTFRPTNDMERQDFVVVLARIAGADLSKYKDKTGGFKDVKKGSYYAPAVAWAADKGIVTGFNSTTFGVGRPLTREQVSTIFYRYMGSPKISGASTALKAFSDNAKISAYAKTAAAWASKNGIITGKGDKFAPKDNATRAQIATIVTRMDKEGMF